MKSVAEILNASIAFLESKKIDRARRVSEELIAHVLKIRRIEIYLQFDRLVIEDELKQIRLFLKKLAQKMPIEYVIGEVDFYGCKIKVDKNVLIPRPETEILVDYIFQRVKKSSSAWDLCTGSGCIGISVKKKLPFLHMTLSDLSKEALSLAKANADLNGVQVEYLQGDLLVPFQGRKTDLLIANPPYLSLKEYFSLDPSVRDFEPKMALVGGEMGTEFYERLAIDMPSFLNAGAQVFLEIGSMMGKAMKEIFSSPIWKIRECIADWSGKDRFFFLEMQ